MNDTTFTRGAWFWLGIVLLLFALGIGSMLYFFSLPTDGWATQSASPLDTQALIYRVNVSGAPSELESGDALIGINEVEDPSQLEPEWRVGQTLRYTVIRGDATREVEVPLMAWQVGPALEFWLLQTDPLSFIGMMIFLAVAALAFFRRPNDHAARALLLYAAGYMALTGIVEVGSNSAIPLVFPSFGLLSNVLTFLAYSVLYPAVLLQLALVFPRPKPIVLRHPWLEYLPYVLGLAIIPFFLTGINIAGYVWTILSQIGALLLVAHSALTMRDALSRAQLGWGLWGFVLAMGVSLTNYLVTFGVLSGSVAYFVTSFASLRFVVLGITLAIAILRYRLFDIGIIIRRTLTYALVTGLSVLVFFGSVILLQQIFSALTGSGQNELVTVLSTLAIAALFVPVRNRIQRELDKRFNRKKYNAQQVLNDFANTVRDETDLESLTAQLMQVVDTTMQPKTVSVWLKKTRQNSRRE